MTDIEYELYGRKKVLKALAKYPGRGLTWSDLKRELAHSQPPISGLEVHLKTIQQEGFVTSIVEDCPDPQPFYHLTPKGVLAAERLKD